MRGSTPPAPLTADRENSTWHAGHAGRGAASTVKALADTRLKRCSAQLADASVANSARMVGAFPMDLPSGHERDQSSRAAVA